MSPIVDDLRIEAEIPPKPMRPGTAGVITLRFSNLGARMRTLFLIGDESYRFGQSTFHLELGTGETLVQPPRRAGYVPTATDFHKVAPRGQLESTQTLRLPRSIEPGKYVVRWVYENDVKLWPSGPKFPSAGKPIPGIWVGRIEDRFEVTVERGLLIRRIRHT